MGTSRNSLRSTAQGKQLLPVQDPRELFSVCCVWTKLTPLNIQRTHPHSKRSADHPELQVILDTYEGGVPSTNCGTALLPHQHPSETPPALQQTLRRVLSRRRGRRQARRLAKPPAALPGGRGDTRASLRGSR